MAYPSFNILLVSQQDDESSILDDIAQSGTSHSRTMRSRVYTRFEVIHDCTWAEYKTLRALYDAGPRDEMTNFVYHNVSPAELYTVRFMARPKIIRNLGDGTFQVSVSLRGYLQ